MQTLTAMPHPELDRLLGDDIVALMGTLNAPFSGAGYPGYQASTFRVRLADGLLLKGRRVGSAGRSETIEYVSQYVDH
jgi:hypothetical protein